VEAAPNVVASQPVGIGLVVVGRLGTDLLLCEVVRELAQRPLLLVERERDACGDGSGELPERACVDPWAGRRPFPG